MHALFNICTVYLCYVFRRRIEIQTFWPFCININFFRYKLSFSNLAWYNICLCFIISRNSSLISSGAHQSSQPCQVKIEKICKTNQDIFMNIQTKARTARTYARTHTNTHARTHTHTHTSTHRHRHTHTQN